MMYKCASLPMFVLFTATGAHVFILLKNDLTRENSIKNCDHPPPLYYIFMIPKFDLQIQQPFEK